jgi:hypothetical protein
MDDKIKSARQTGILLILLLVFTFNLNNNFEENIEQFNIIWGFWIHDALKPSSKAIPKLKLNESCFIVKDVQKNLSKFHQNTEINMLINNIGWFDNKIERDGVLEVTMDWNYIEFRLFTGLDFASGSADNDYKSTFIFSSYSDINRIVTVDAIGEELASYGSIPIEPKKLAEFFTEFRNSIVDFTIYSSDNSWDRDEYDKGKAHTFFHVNYGLDIKELRQTTLELAREFMKGQVTLPVFNVTMEIEKAYLHILGLVTTLLIYLNSQLRLINAAITKKDFGGFSLTGWKVHTNNSLANIISRIIEAIFGFIGYMSATLTPFIVLCYLWYFNVEIGEYEFNSAVVVAVIAVLMLITLLTITNILQIFRKPFTRNN